MSPPTAETSGSSVSPSDQGAAPFRPPDASTAGAERLCTIAAVLLVVIACARIAATYGVFCQVYDEPFHVVRGYQWLTGADYTHPLHPPLAPIFVATGPLLDGADILLTDNKRTDGNSILHQGNYFRRLGLARAGNLVFFLWSLFAIWRWCREAFGPVVAVAAVGLYTNTPPILAHAGFATTDMAITAAVCATIPLFSRWSRDPSLRNSVVLGAMAGLALLSKLSALLFLPVAACCVMAARIMSGPWPELRPWFRGGRVVSILFVGWMVLNTVWIGYRFSTAPVGVMDEQSEETTNGLSRLLNMTGHVPVPAPEFVRGLQLLVNKNHRGHAPYFLGKARREASGSPVFFPVVLAVKTPIPILLLFAVGVIRLVLTRHDQRRSMAESVPFYCAVGLLLSVMPSNINLGVRHILPIYPLICIGAALGAEFAWKGRGAGTSSQGVAEPTSRSPQAGFGVRSARAVLVVLIGWLVLQSARAHPDYLPYFNELAGSNPEEILVDSDLDWGQDLPRLGAELRRRNVDHVALAYFGSAELEPHGLPEVTLLRAARRVTGYVAVSITLLRTKEEFAWLNEYEPVAKVGRSILLFNIPEGDPQNKYPSPGK